MSQPTILRSLEGFKASKPLFADHHVNSFPDPHGKYILTFGLPQSGKSTFQNFLVRYLAQSSQFAVEPMCEDSKALLFKWRDDWREGRFMDATARGTPKEFRHRVRPLPGARFSKELVFRFFELSGEELRDNVVFSPGREQNLWAETKALLDCNEGKLFMVLMCDGADLAGNDKFFVDLLTYVQKSLPQANFASLKKRARIMLIISKPHLALRQRYEEGRRSDMPITKEMIKTFMPDTWKHIKLDWRQEPLMARLSLGTIVRVEENGEERDKLVTPDFTHIAAIFERIYNHLTGVSYLRRAFDGLWE